MQTETLTIKSTPLADGKVKAKTGNTTDATVYANWYKAVYLPVAVEAVSLQKNAGEKVVADTGKTEKGLN